MRTEPDGVLEALERLLERQRTTERELSRLRSSSLESDAAALGAEAVDGVVVARRDGQTRPTSCARWPRRRGDVTGYGRRWWAGRPTG